MTSMNHFEHIIEAIFSLIKLQCIQTWTIAIMFVPFELNCNISDFSFLLFLFTWSLSLFSFQSNYVKCECGFFFRRSKSLVLFLSFQSSFYIVQISGQCQRSNQRVDSDEVVYENVHTISMWIPTFRWMCVCVCCVYVEVKRRKNIYLWSVCLAKRTLPVIASESLELIRPHQIHINFNGILVSQQQK